LGNSGVGIVIEAQTNLFGLEKGKRVYIEPNRECGECFNCKNECYTDCSNLQIAGEDFDGFLCDFRSEPCDKLFLLPDSVSNTDALFLGHISTALEIIDLLKIQKGDYVSVIGADSFGIIFAQLLIYYQAVPILMTIDEERYNIAKESGIYYVLGKDDNWQKEVSIITGGRLTEKVVYISDCNISSSKAFALASHNASVVFTGTTYNNTVPFMQAVKKQLNILCVNNGFGNTASSINLLANKALDLSHLKIETTGQSHVPQTLKELNDDYQENGKTNEVIVEWL
jgi:threonine dehydrogenase-like Zn-dependent dehydrogenase